MDKKHWFLACFLIYPALSYALSSPLGSWQTYDLKHTPRSIIRLSEHHGELEGYIIKSFTGMICKNCVGAQQGKPYRGMKILWGLKQQGDSWKNGWILDVDNGKTYRCNLRVSDDNKTLFFSPYIGSPLFGVTIKWDRVD